MILDGKRPFCVFESPLGGFRGNVVNVYVLGLIGKRVVDFLLVRIDLFC